MLGFDALCALPLADDAINEDEAGQTILAAISGDNRMGASQSGSVRPQVLMHGSNLIGAQHGGSSRPSASIRGGTRVQIG